MENNSVTEDLLKEITYIESASALFHKMKNKNDIVNRISELTLGKDIIKDIDKNKTKINQLRFD